jgi:non-specific serine/threonine protein kinase/serine/threonine-protein kinase
VTLAGRYSAGELLGRGGMGEVRSGWDRVLDRPVAIKTLREDAASNPLVRRRFEAEARAAGRLVHPNVVQVYDSGEDHGIPFMVMERLSGHSLREEIQSRKLSVPEVSDLAVQVLAALAAAHGAGLVHRDIKPANILSAGKGHWKVADFGIAKSVQPAGDDTMTGMVLGTPAYLPPERLLGGDATPSGDLYALGVILYEALAGEKPFRANDPSGWVSAISTGPRPLRAVRSDVPAAFAAAIERSMSRDPGQRFTDAGQMAAALQAARSGGPTERTGWLGVAPAMPADGGSSAAGATEVLPTAQTPEKRRLWLAGLAAGLGVLLAASIALAAMGGGAKARTRTPPTTAAVQVTTPSTLPTTTVPAPPPPHDHSGGDQKGEGDHGDHGG